MASKRIIFGLAALTAGVFLGYLQTRFTRPACVVAPNVVVEQPDISVLESTEQAVEASRPSASVAASRPSSSSPKVVLIAPIPAPEVQASSPVPSRRTILVGIAPEDEHPVRLKLPLQDDEKLWSESFDLGGSRNEFDGKTLDFMGKKDKTDQIPPLDIGSSNVGKSYRLLRTDATNFMGRVAGGFSKDYDGLKDGQQIPEMIFGFQFEHEIDKRNKIVGGMEFGRDVTEPGRRRVCTQAAWEVLVDPAKNISVRTGVLERSNQTGEGETTKNKNLDYTLDVIWKF